MVKKLKDKCKVKTLNKIDENMFGLLISEKLLSKDWLTKEEEEAWKDL